MTPEGSATTSESVGQRPALRLASGVMFVRDLVRSVDFYRELLRWEVTVRDETAALLVGPGGYQLYLREMGERAPHPLGNVGIQYLMWTAEDEEDLHRCEQVLEGQSSQVTRYTVDDITIVEGRGPDNVPLMVSYPGPEEAPRHEILQRIYHW